MESYPYVAQLCQNSIPIALFPALTFLVSAFIAFAIGTSWGTFAIMLPIAAPLAASGDLSQALLLSAVLGGGVFGTMPRPSVIPLWSHQWQQRLITSIM